MKKAMGVWIILLSSLMATMYLVGCWSIQEKVKQESKTSEVVTHNNLLDAEELDAVVELGGKVSEEKGDEVKSRILEILQKMRKENAEIQVINNEGMVDKYKYNSLGEYVAYTDSGVGIQRKDNTFAYINRESDYVSRTPLGTIDMLSLIEKVAENLGDGEVLDIQRIQKTFNENDYYGIRFTGIKSIEKLFNYKDDALLSIIENIDNSEPESDIALEIIVTYPSNKEKENELLNKFGISVSARIKTNKIELAKFNGYNSNVGWKLEDVYYTDIWQNDAELHSLLESINK